MVYRPRLLMAPLSPTAQGSSSGDGDLGDEGRTPTPTARVTARPRLIPAGRLLVAAPALRAMTFRLGFRLNDAFLQRVIG